MDLSVVFKAAIALLVQFFEIKFKFFGYTFTVASCFIFAGMFTAFVGFIKSLDF